jgi:hypothetical protein
LLLLLLVVGAVVKKSGSGNMLLRLQPSFEHVQRACGDGCDATCTSTSQYILQLFVTTPIMTS